MPSNNLAPETPPSRGISSRLLTMKFMQRAVASESNPASPQSAESSAKRRKVDSPLTGEFHSFDEAAIQAAMKQQEATRQAALSKHKVDAADTPWVLSGFETSDKPTAAARPSQNVAVVGFTNIDASEGQEDQLQRVKAGRQRTGNFKSKADQKSTGVRPAESEKSDSSDGSDDSDDGSDDGTPGGARGRRHSSHKKAAEASRARDFRDKRKKSEVNLNAISSISGGASISSGGGGGFSKSTSFTCHSCGQPGHKIADCPEKRRQRGSGGGRGRGGGGGEKRKSFN